MVGVFLGRWMKEEPEAYEKNMEELLELFKQGKIKPASYQSFKMNDFGYASAGSFLMLIVVMVFVMLFFTRLRKTYE